MSSCFVRGRRSGEANGTEKRTEQTDECAVHTHAKAEDDVSVYIGGANGADERTERTDGCVARINIIQLARRCRGMQSCLVKAVNESFLSRI